jgi:hypothetical protein
VSAVVSSTGTVLERLSYDPWGKRRNSNGTLNTFTIPAGTQIFTGGVANGAEGATQIYIQNPSVLIPK